MTTITWHKCSDQMPDDDESVLLACDDGEVQVGFLDAGTWRYQDAMPRSFTGSASPTGPTCPRIRMISGPTAGRAYGFRRTKATVTAQL